jgi:CBS domain containing-hemolysin-like protein
VTPALGLAVVAALIAANGFFVAAEFGLVAARRTAVEERAEQGSRRARAALREMRRISFTLSGAQFGITASSLLLGYVAADAFEQILAPVIGLLDLPETTALAASLLTALAISTVVQMVVGELAPKNLAISRPEPTALAVAPAVRVYALVFGPLIRLFDGAANRVTRWLGFEPRDEVLAGYSAAELGRIIEASAEQLSEDQSERLLAAVELGDRRVAEVMVPRPDVAWVPASAPISAVREASRRTGHSRFPVAGDSEDDVVGTIHIKDLLRVEPDQHDDVRVGDIADDALVVPESHTLWRFLADLRRQQRTFAVVVDEYGGVAGIITLEDVVEELFGEIEDEFDLDVPALRRLGAGRLVIPGRLRTSRLEQLLGEELPEGDYETVAGFVIEVLGRIPGPGESVTHGDWRFVVMKVEGNRIVEILLERTPAQGSPGGPPGAEDRS